MTKSLDEQLPEGINYTKPGGGLNIWLKMPYGFSSANLLKHAVSAGIVFTPGRIFYADSAPVSLNNIRLSFAATGEDQINSGVERLCEIIGSMLHKDECYRNMPIL